MVYYGVYRVETRPVAKIDSSVVFYASLPMDIVLVSSSSELRKDELWRGGGVVGFLEWLDHIVSRIGIS